MGYAIIMLAGLIGVAAILVMGREHGMLIGSVVHLPRHPSSPLDEAERILALRYAKGEITPEEYHRMLVILRR